MLRLSREEVRAIDRRAIEELGLPGIVLMENAARGACAAIADLAPPPRSVCLLCGAGNNGGDAYALARHLHNAAYEVRLLAARSLEDLTGDARTMAQVAARMGLAIDDLSGEPTLRPEHLDGAALLVDGLLGTGAVGEVRAPLDSWIETLNAVARERSLPVVALDLPSGLDCDTGRAARSTVRADLTVTFVAEKSGFGQESARAFVGQVVVASIGTPREWLS